MFSLNMVRTEVIKSSGKGTKFGHKAAFDLIANAISAPTLIAALAVIRAVALTLPASRKRGKTGKLLPGWREWLIRLCDGLERGEVPFAIFARGNGKLPFWAFSVAPFFTCPGMGDCARFCYSRKAWQYPSAFARMLQNTLLMVFCPEVVRSAFRALDCSERKTVRLYVDGDIANGHILAFWMAEIALRPEVNVYGYSKSFELFIEYHRQGGVFPPNYVLNLSGGHRYDADIVRQMEELPVVRGKFLAVPVEYNPVDPKTGQRFKGQVPSEFKYSDPAYHAAVRKAAMEQGLGKVFSCPGFCGQCRAKQAGKHACGDLDFRATIAIGIH